MYNSRIGRRTRRVSDSKLNPRLQDRRVVDADDDDAEDLKLGDLNLTPEEVQGLLELLPYKEALIKIAKGEFEIEKVEEAEETEEAKEDETAEGETEEGAESEEENFEADEDMSTEGSDEEEFDEEDYEDEEDETVEDSAVVDAWAKRLKGNQK